jgi:hypothetical protein
MIGIEPQKEWSEKLQYKLGKALRWKKFSIRLLRKICRVTVALRTAELSGSPNEPNRISLCFSG